MEILIATKNIGKVHEIEAYLGGLDLKMQTLLTVTGIPEPVEDGTTFEENAVTKALHCSRFTDILVLADDSGLIVDHLDGRPGVLSSRYAGAGASDEKRCEKVLKEMEGVAWNKRTARFECVIALARSGKVVSSFRGMCNGYIAFEMKGRRGFGYDPIFFFPPLQKTFAELERGKRKSKPQRSRTFSYKRIPPEKVS